MRYSRRSPFSNAAPFVPCRYDSRAAAAETRASPKPQRSKKAGAGCLYDFDAIENIYEDRAAFPHSKAFYLDEEYSGESIISKLSRIRKYMDNKNADIHIMATLDDICWTFNIRGCDVECNPVIMAYSVITKDEAYIYTDKDRFDDKTLAKFGEACVEVLPYDSIYEDIARMNGKVLIDKRRVNMCIY